MQVSRDVTAQVEREEAETRGDKIYTGKEGKERNWAVRPTVLRHSHVSVFESRSYTHPRRGRGARTCDSDVSHSRSKCILYALGWAGRRSDSRDARVAQAVRQVAHHARERWRASLRILYVVWVRDSPDAVEVMLLVPGDGDSERGPTGTPRSHLRIGISPSCRCTPARDGDYMGVEWRSAHMRVAATSLCLRGRWPVSVSSAL